MKYKYLFQFIVAVAALLLSVQAYSQCSPGSYTSQGFYPDTTTGLDSAYVGVAYSEVITVVIPADTAFTSFPGVVGTINHFTIDSIVGLPPGYSYSCNPSTCIIPGGSSGCILIEGPAPLPGSEGSEYPFTIYGRYNVNIPGLGGTNVASNIDGYSIAVASNANCVPGTFTSQGFYPDTITGLDSAYVGVYYSEVITVVVPTDTTDNYPPWGVQTADVNYFTIDSIAGLPPGYSYSCTPPDCIIQGGNSGCILIQGPAPLPGSEGNVYPFTIYVTPNVYHPVFGSFDLDQTPIDGYNIAVSSFVPCTPGTFANQGFYPDTITGLDSAHVGAAYSEVITVVVPTDTTVNYPPWGVLTGTVNYFTINSIDGLPPGYSYSCNPPDCIIPGGSSGCILIEGPAPLPGSEGNVYPFTIYVTPNIYHSIIGSFNWEQTPIHGYSIAVAHGNQSGAQCDTGTFTAPGFYPDSVTDFDVAHAGVPYNDVLMIFPPADTTISATTYDITYVIESINGLPQGFSYECVPSSCVFPGGVASCLVITSNGPSAGQVGTYPLEIKYSSYISHISVGTLFLDSTTVENYQIVIDNVTGVNGGQIGTNTFLLYPNPGDGIFNYQFMANSDHPILTIFDHTGRMVFTENKQALSGTLYKGSIDLTHQAAGMYYIQVINADKVLNQKLIVR